MNLPPKNRPPLEGKRFNVLVIGGGINGVAIARECARGGRSVLLVEQNDFCSGTTSRSTRIIHGGLRYLEHGEIGLVRESLRERERLLRERPHLVRRKQFLIALGERSRRSALEVRVGLWLYCRLGGTARSRGNHVSPGVSFERLLDSGHRWSIFDYEDAQCEFPERLLAEWLLEGTAAGAVVRNHAQVLAVDVRNGRARGALIRDLLSGKEERIEASWVINASGPWVDRLCQRSSIRRSSPLIGGVRGSHIVLPVFAGAPEKPVLMEASDSRPFFLIPWNEQILVGTTEVPDRDDPTNTMPSSAEVDYLLTSMRNLFPTLAITTADIRYAFAGVRPLPFVGEKTPSAITRRHFLHEHSDDGAQNMISIVGGKLTTAAELARQCARKIGIGVAESHVGVAISRDGRATLDEFAAEIASAAGVSEDCADAIAEWYGSKSLEVARLARTSPEMKAKLCPHTAHIVAEAMYALQGEYACTLGDVLLRRVPVTLGPCWTEECSRSAAARIGTALGWTEAQVSAELEQFESERKRFLIRPADALE